MELQAIAKTINEAKENVSLVYAFNGTGKTQLSVAFKEETKNKEQHTGVYYNAYSEDLFIWDNENEGQLIVVPSSLNVFHSLLNEVDVRDKLEPFKPTYDFEFVFGANQEDGIESIFFFSKDDLDKNKIKISRGEERIFIWCFYLALFEVEGWADKQSSHFFIDDPVSSLDDFNIFITASTVFDLIERHHQNRKIIVTTHHIGFFAILSDWLKKGEKSNKYKNITKLYILSKKSGEVTLESTRNDVILHHLQLMQALENASNEQLQSYHFALLRQVLESISSFLGVGRVGYVLDKIGMGDANRVNDIINFLSHEKIYYLGFDKMSDDNEKLFKEIFGKIKTKYDFVLHAG